VTKKKKKYDRRKLAKKGKAEKGVYLEGLEKKRDPGKIGGAGWW